MFEDYKKYKRILVTGPQRSGTRICAKMIAEDTGYEYLDDRTVIHISELREAVKQDGVVVQCPGMARWIHWFGDDDTLIVWMKRPLKEILASEKRVNWGHNLNELATYGVEGGISSEVKNKFWVETQRGKIKHFVEQDYKKLAKHRLWVDKKRRSRFTGSQTK